MRADASNAAKMPAVGVMDADYANNTSGANGIISGTLSSVNTNGYTVNSPIYVADGGGYSNTAGTIPQQVGITERANANTGAFIVTSPKLISFADITDSETGTATLGLSSISIYPSGKIYYASTNSGGFVGLSGQLATDARDVYLPNASGNLALVTSTTGQIASADVSGLTALATTTPGTNVANFLATPTSANLASALTDENGTGGGFVRAEGATLTSPALVGPVNLTSQDSSTAGRVMNRGLGDERYLDWYNSVRLSPSELSAQHSAGGTTTANFRGITIFNITTAASSTALMFSKIAYFAGESSSLLFSYSKNRLLSFTTNRFTLRSGAVAEATICDNLPINNSKAFGVRFTTSNCAAFVRNGTIETVGAAVSALPYSRFILDYIAGSRLDVYGVIAGGSPTLLSTVNSGLPTGNGGSDLSNLILCLYDTGSGGAAANAGFSNIIFHTKP